MKRLQEEYIVKDLNKKMVILVGPRQVGKTWIARSLAKHFNNVVYLNYDNRQDRAIIQKEAWLPSTELLIFDEIHKMNDWKNFVKGIYDTKPDSMKIIITGSARLDTYKNAGDSLAGRYFLHRLLPLSMKEIASESPGFSFERLMERGGFPEPFLAETTLDADRWRMQYSDGLIRYDILDFENIHNLNALNTVFELLRERVGSPISYSSIAQDVGVSSVTVKKYIEILEALYIIFRITPFSRNIGRALLKEPKIYFYDSGLVKGDQGILFENTIAVSLLKNAYCQTDYTGKLTQIQYIRTKEGKEIDFCIVKNDHPSILMETKYSDNAISQSLYIFCTKYKIPGIQLVCNLRNEREEGLIKVLSASKYLIDLSF